MATINTNGITGTDGIVPVYQPNARWCIWNLEEIYDGNQGANRYVPKVNDYVEDSVGFITYIVTAIDPVTLKSTLLPINRNNNNGSISYEDVIIGVGPGTQADTYRIYLDTSITPHILAVDIRLKVAGTMASYAKIFRGTNLSSTGKVISFLYDTNGNFLTQNVPLELVAIDSHVNHSIKTVSVCYTNESLSDGELVTVVIYTAEGHVVSRRQMLVENTSFIRSLNSSQKYISHISLKSPFLSSTDENTLMYPINVPMQAFNMIGVVHYSDNSTMELPVDGGKFKVLGLERYIATVVGQELKLVLSYSLSPGEICYGAVTGDGKFVTQPYRLVTTNQIGAYTVKLYCYPVWVDNNTGYRLKWYMYNLDRDTRFDVTPFVRTNDNTPSFLPKTYGVAQNLSVRLNLRDVSGIFNSYIHVQNIQITLRDPGTARQTNWTIGFEPNQDPQYGVGLHADTKMRAANLSDVVISFGSVSKDDWLNRIYYASKPITDKVREIKPPEPDFFAIVTETNRYEYPIGMWNNPIQVPTVLNPNETLFIEFFKRTASTDILLGIAGMPLYEG